MKRNFMIGKIDIIMQRFPEGLTVQEITTGLNQEIRQPLTPGGVNYWINQALDSGLICIAGQVKGKGRPCNVFAHHRFTASDH